MGTLGAGNHYAEIQVVDEVFDKAAAGTMGIDRVGQIVVMIHSGSRGLGHQVATDALTEMERAMARDGIATNDRQLACARIHSKEGQDYLVRRCAATVPQSHYPCSQSCACFAPLCLAAPQLFCRGGGAQRSDVPVSPEVSPLIVFIS